MAYKDSAQYDAWARDYDSFAADSEKKGEFPFQGWSIALETLAKTIDGFAKDAEVLDLGCGTGDLEQILLQRGHQVTGIDFSSAMLAIAREKAAGATFIQHDLSSGFLPASLKGKKFKVITSSLFLHRLPRALQPAFINYLNFEVLADGGLILIYDACFDTTEDLTKFQADHKKDLSQDNYPILADLKEFIPNLVFQRISPQGVIIACPKFAAQPVDEDEAKQVDRTLGYVEEAREREFKNGEDEKPHQTNWKRLREIPGNTLTELAKNFSLALLPYEAEAEKNWSILKPRLKNLFHGTFTNSDILNFRVQALTSYTASGVPLPQQDEQRTAICTMFVASYLKARFPSDKININLFGLYLLLRLDLENTFIRLEQTYGNDSKKVAADMKAPQGKPITSILTYDLKI